MTTPDVSILYSARIDGSVTTGSAGDVLIEDATSGAYVKATTAARAGRRSTGVARTSYAPGGTVEIQQTGWLPATISGLAAGSVSWVRVSAAGTLERCTPGAGDDIIGKCRANGDVCLAPGTWDSSNYAGGGGGGGGTPGGADGDIQVNSAGAFGGITPAAGMTTFITTPSGANLAATLTTPLPVSKGGTGLTALGTGVATFLGTPSGANLASALTSALPVSKGGTGLTALTIPASGLLVGTTDTQTLSGKTIAGASNTLTVRIANDVTGLGTGVATFLGTPSGANLASALTSALPDTKGGTGLTALGTGVATFLGTPSSANLFTALTTKTGSGGSAVFATGPTLSSPIIVGQVQGAAVAIAALAIDWSLGTVFTKTLSAGANTFTFSNQASGMTITVRVTGAASTLTWPTVKWAGGAAPTQTASGTDVYTFVHDGTSIYGSVVQNMS